MSFPVAQHINLGDFFPPEILINFSKTLKSRKCYIIEDQTGKGTWILSQEDK